VERCYARTVSDVEEHDRPHYAELLRLLGAVDDWVARIDPNAERRHPALGSPLRGDDERTHPYEISHAAWHALSHAVDQLHCLRSVLRDAQMIHMYAPYSLVRPALENASAAVWMLHPANRIERITRRLRYAAVDIRNGEQAKELVGAVGPRSEEARLDEVRDLAKLAGVDPDDVVRKVGYWQIVNAANEVLAAGSKAVPFTWKLCSGIAHGDLWTTISAAERVELPGAPPGMGVFQLTANLKILMYVTTFATHMTMLGWRLYDERRRAPY
jgi:hypothetical protein